MATIITPYILKQIKGKKFKGNIKEKQELIKRAGQHGISHFQMQRELEELGYEKKDAKEMVALMCDLADERKKKNIKAANRLSKAFGLGIDESNSGEISYQQRKFAGETNKSKRDLMLKKLRRGGLASAKSDMKFIEKKISASALGGDGSKKAGFAGKLQKKSTGFAGQIEKPNNITKSGGGVASGIGSNPGGNGPMRL